MLQRTVPAVDSISKDRIDRWHSQTRQSLEFETRNLLEHLSIQIRWLKEWDVREGHSGRFVFPYTAIWLVTGGKATILYDQTPYIIGKGDIVCIPPQTCQSWQSIDDSEPFHYYAFALEAKIGLLDFIRLYRFPRVASAVDPSAFGKLLQSWHNVADQCTSYTETIKEERVNGLQQARLDTNQAIQYLKMQTLGLSWLLQLFETLRSFLPERPVMYDHRIFQICNYVAAHLSDPMTLDDLAERAALGKEQFRSLFQQTLGTSPMKYVQLMRMQRAKELLSLTVYPIKDISAQVGFESQHHFSRAFRKHAGISPLEYRRHHTE